MFARAYGRRKTALLGPLRGDVLELGPGAGANLPYYGAGVRWVGVEPNRYAQDMLRAKAAGCGLAAEVVEGVAESLPVPDASVDTVVATLLLCSVADPVQVLAEARRVLRPGGRFVFLEHVGAAPGSATRRWQERIEPVWRPLADGCRLTLDSEALVRAAFPAVEVERFSLSSPGRLLADHVAGVAFVGGAPERSGPDR